MFPGVTLLVFVALVAIYLLGTFLTQGEKSETYLDAAAIVGMMGIFFAGKTLSLLLFMSILVALCGSVVCHLLLPAVQERGETFFSEQMLRHSVRIGNLSGKRHFCRFCGLRCLPFSGARSFLQEVPFAALTGNGKSRNRFFRYICIIKTRNQ